MRDSKNIVTILLVGIIVSSLTASYFYSDNRKLSLENQDLQYKADKYEYFFDLCKGLLNDKIK